MRLVLHGKEYSSQELSLFYGGFYLFFGRNNYYVLTWFAERDLNTTLDYKITRRLVSDDFLKKTFFTNFFLI